MSPKRIIDVPYSITQADPNFTLGSDIAAGLATGAEHLLGTFLCPVGLTVVVLPVSSLAMYLKDLEVAPAEFANSVPVRIEHADSAGNIRVDRIKAIYAGVKDFADANVMKRFQDKFTVTEKEKLLVYSTPPSGSSIDVSACYFEVLCRRVSKLLSV